MPVDVDNNFNSAEDKVQYALGTMNVYSVTIEHTYKNKVVSGANYAGIIALNRIEALTKILHSIASASFHLIDEQDLTLRVNLCQ